MALPQARSKITSAVWASLDDLIITGHENGELVQWDVKEGDRVHGVMEHNKQINDIQTSKDQAMIITASKDHTSKVSTLLSLKRQGNKKFVQITYM